MCESKGCNTNNACCPTGQIFQEKACGNITHPIDQTVWQAPAANDYFQGTFEVFNAGPGNIDFSVSGNPGSGVITVPPGNSVSVSVNSPTNFIVQTFTPGTTGKWCITLFKRVF